MFKKAYLRALNDPAYKNTISQIKAAVFLSTPHRGSGLAKTLDSILSLWLSPFSQKAFIKELSKGSPTLEDINEDFRHFDATMELYSFYELKKTSLSKIKKVSQPCMRLIRGH